LLRDVSIPLVAAQDGLLACYVGRPIGRNDDEFTMVSIWRDLDALRAFTGEDWESPVIPDEREAAIIVESFAHHYDGFWSMPAPRLS
jgi:heme-degrading monooxygenase HmoA